MLATHGIVLNFGVMQTATGHKVVGQTFILDG